MSKKTYDFWNTEQTRNRHKSNIQLVRISHQVINSIYNINTVRDALRPKGKHQLDLYTTPLPHSFLPSPSFVFVSSS